MILWNTITIFVANSEVVLSICISLFRRFAIPLYCFNIILGNTITFVVANSEVVLSLGISLLSRLEIPLHCFSIILGNTNTMFVANSEVVLSICISLFSRLAIPLYCFNIILGNTITLPGMRWAICATGIPACGILRHPRRGPGGVCHGHWQSAGGIVSVPGRLADLSLHGRMESSWIAHKMFIGTLQVGNGGNLRNLVRGNGRRPPGPPDESRS